MKRIIFLCLAVLSLLSALSGCASPVLPAAQMENPVDFFYRRSEVLYGVEDGVIGSQTVDLGQADLQLAQLLDRYLTEPIEEGLESPFPKEVTVLSVSEEHSTVVVQLGGAYAGLTGIQATVADACLAKTLLRYCDADSVRLVIVDAQGQTLRSRKMADSDILLYDDSSDTSSVSLTLYFTDEHSRYLIAERRTVPYMPAEELPHYLVSQLISGPETVGLKKTLPNGTRLLDINVDNDICAVDFSVDFLNNRPQTAAEERIALLSVVNTLTELENIGQVQFYVEGRRQDTLSFLNLAGHFTADAVAIGPVREDLNEFDATVYLPIEGSGLLYPVPARLKTDKVSQVEAVLRMLSAYEPKNGLQNPLFGKPVAELVQVERNCCVLNFPSGTVLGEDAATELAAIHEIAASITALDGITAVRILVDGTLAELSFHDLPQQIRPQQDWYCSKIVP